MNERLAEGRSPTWTTATGSLLAVHAWTHDDFSRVSFVGKVVGCDEAANQLVGGRHGLREERVRSPDVVDVCSPEPGVFEQVGGLAVDLEGVLVIESINIE